MDSVNKTKRYIAEQLDKRLPTGSYNPQTGGLSLKQGKERFGIDLPVSRLKNGTKKFS